MYSSQKMGDSFFFFMECTEVTFFVGIVFSDQMDMCPLMLTLKKNSQLPVSHFSHGVT